jgi:hypothetical protein
MKHKMVEEYFNLGFEYFKVMSKELMPPPENLLMPTEEQSVRL